MRNPSHCRLFKVPLQLLMYDSCSCFHSQQDVSVKRPGTDSENNKKRTAVINVKVISVKAQRLPGKYLTIVSWGGAKKKKKMKKREANDQTLNERIHLLTKWKGTKEMRVSFPFTLKWFLLVSHTKAFSVYCHRNSIIYRQQANTYIRD